MTWETDWQGGYLSETGVIRRIEVENGWRGVCDQDCLRGGLREFSWRRSRTGKFSADDPFCPCSGGIHPSDDGRICFRMTIMSSQPNNATNWGYSSQSILLCHAWGTHNLSQSPDAIISLEIFKTSQFKSSWSNRGIIQRGKDIPELNGAFFCVCKINKWDDYFMILLGALISVRNWFWNSLDQIRSAKWD